MTLFHKHGFKCVSAINLLTASGENLCNNYFDPEGPLMAEWRQETGLFEIATDEEIRDMEDFLLNKKREGTLESFMRLHDHTQDRGHETLFACIAQSASQPIMRFDSEMPLQAKDVNPSPTKELCVKRHKISRFVLATETNNPLPEIEMDYKGRRRFNKLKRMFFYWSIPLYREET